MKRKLSESGVNASGSTGKVSLFVEWISGEDMAKGNLVVRSARIDRPTLLEALMVMLNTVEVPEVPAPEDVAEMDPYDIIDHIQYYNGSDITCDAIIVLKNMSDGSEYIDNRMNEERL